MMQKEIRCQICDVLFGKEISMTEADAKILTIKSRDLYRSYKGGTVWGPCRGCGNTVVWPVPQQED